MIIVNPQWQGIGSKNAVPKGAESIKEILRNLDFQTISLNNEDIVRENDVNGLTQIESLISEAAELVQNKSPDKIFTCGGDCSSDFAQLTYLNDKYKGDLTLIWIDAHADLHLPETSPSKNFHGMTLRGLTGEGSEAITKHVKRPLTPDQIVFSGLRSFEEEEERYIKENNVKVFTTDETRNGAFNQFNIATQNVYVHVDIDSLDQSVFNDCATPTSGGFMLEELIDLINALMAKKNVVGGCLTEYGPREDGNAREIVEKLLLEGFRVQDRFTPQSELTRDVG